MSRRISLSALWALTGVLLFGGLLAAQGSGRVRGTVVDETGQPIPDVQVTISCEVTNFLETLTTDKKGGFAVAFVDATEPYLFRFVKEGYVTTVAELKPRVGSNLRQEFVMPSLAAAGEPEGGVVEAKADPAVETFNQGVAAAKAGDLTLAAEKFEEARKKSPRRPEPIVGLASVYRDQGRGEEAAVLAEEALTLDPGNVQALLVLFDVKSAAGDEAGANEAMGRLKVAGGGSEAAVRIYNVGVHAAREGSLDAALRLFQEALALDPSLAAAHGARAAILLGRGEAQAAVEAADAALAADPAYTGVLQVKYDAYRALKDVAGAQRALEAWAAADPAGTATALYEKGRALFEEGKAAEAAEALRGVLAVDAEHARAHYLLGLCLFNLGQGNEAKTHLERFLELAPDDPEAPNARQMLEYAE